MVRLFAHTFLVGLLLLAWVQSSRAQTVPDTNATPASYSLTISLPKVVMSSLETPVTLQVEPAAAALNLPNRVQVNGQEQAVSWQDGKAKVVHRFPTGADPLTIVAGAARAEQTVHPIPAWLSVIPPLLAILMALVFREVLSALFLGIFVGAAIIGCYQEGWLGIFTGLFAVIDTYVLDSLTNSGHQSIGVFSMVIGAVVAVVSRNGGMQGVVNRIAAMANTARSGQLATWILGISIFFDDYANTLVVGNTMRAVTDKLRISREKLSYLVDSTAAPVAAIAFVTTWIGAELGSIEDGIADIPEMQGSVYSIFVHSLAYSFYPIFTLAFMLMLVLKNRDFGPMYRAEHRARTTGLVQNRPLDAKGSNS
ncbi:MAG: hypothetical protein AAGB22_04040, partial [Bacteroidota bacterium]